MHFLQVQGLSFQHDDRHVVQNIHFIQQPLQKIAIAGETGSGKSTLLKMIAGFVQPAEGNTFFLGERVLGPWEKLIPGHPGIAYLSQQYELPKFLRVEQVLQYANQQSADAAQQLFEICRITHLMKRKTDQLSGGEQQRIALARILVGNPKLLLLDEPFSNLDPIHKNILKAVLQDVEKELQVSCILTSHDPFDTLSWADEMLILKEGQLVQSGTPEDLYRKPVNEYVAGLLGKYNIVSQTLAEILLINTIFSKEQKLMVRPENIEVYLPTENAIQGVVVNTRFIGSGYEINIQVQDETITARTNQNTWQKGNVVSIGLNENAIWVMPG